MDKIDTIDDIHDFLNPSRLISSIICFFSSVLIMFNFQKYASRNMIKGFPILPDILHRKEFEFFTKFYTVSDYFITFYLLSLILYFNSHISIFLFQLSIIYLLRSFSFSITLLSKPGKMSDKNHDQSSLKMLYDYISLNDKHTGMNNDLLFSGHTSFMCLYSLYLAHFEYVPDSVLVSIWMINGFLSILNVLSRCHYSIDVFYAYIATIFVFQNTIELLK